jgi:hypothetical protein
MLPPKESAIGEPTSKEAKWGAPVQESVPQRRGPPINGSDMTRREAADYIATLVDELKSIAQAAGLPLIAYLLAMAKEEAQVERARDD